jgi:putative transposase
VLPYGSYQFAEYSQGPRVGQIEYVLIDGATFDNLMFPTAFPRLRHVWLDTGYNGKDKGKDWIERTLGWSAQIVAHRPRPSKVWIFDDLPDDQIDWSKYLPPPGFRVLPRRWVVERTFGWQSQQRRLSKDYERLCATSEAWIYVAMIRLMLRRLTRF